MPTLAKTIFELERIFRQLNKRFFSGKLQMPVIAVQTQGKRGAKNWNVLGWCTTKKVWVDSKDENNTRYEITMTAENLTRSDEQIIATLLHEMVHLYCLQCAIKDTSRGSTYHNTTFKAMAEAHGLTVEHIETHGWTKTSLSPETAAYLPELKINRQAFRVSRQSVTRQASEKPKQSSRKYECPCCGTSVRATKEVNIRCGDCNLDMLAI